MRVRLAHGRGGYADLRSYKRDLARNGRYAQELVNYGTPQIPSALAMVQHAEWSRELPPEGDVTGRGSDAAGEGTFQRLRWRAELRDRAPVRAMGAREAEPSVPGPAPKTATTRRKPAKRKPARLVFGVADGEMVGQEEQGIIWQGGIYGGS